MLLEQELLALGIERAQAEKMAAYGAGWKRSTKALI